DRKMVFRAGTYVDGISAASTSRPCGTASAEVSDEPPIARKSISISSWRSTPSARATARADSTSRARRWPYAIVSAHSVNCSFAIAAAVYESRPPLNSTTARTLDAPGIGRPDELVQLDLQARGHSIGEHPFGQRARVEHAVDRRQQHGGRARIEAVRADHFARELVVGAVLDHELHF